MDLRKEDISNFINYLKSDAEFRVLDSTDLASPYVYSSELVEFLSRFKGIDPNLEFKVSSSECSKSNLSKFSVQDLATAISNLVELEKTYVGTISASLKSGLLLELLEEIEQKLS